MFIVIDDSLIIKHSECHTGNKLEADTPMKNKKDKWYSYINYTVFTHQGTCSLHESSELREDTCSLHLTNKRNFIIQHSQQSNLLHQYPDNSRLFGPHLRPTYVSSQRDIYCLILFSDLQQRSNVGTCCDGQSHNMENGNHRNHQPKTQRWRAHVMRTNDISDPVKNHTFISTCYWDYTECMSLISEVIMNKNRSKIQPWDLRT